MGRRHVGASTTSAMSVLLVVWLGACGDPAVGNDATVPHDAGIDAEADARPDRWLPDASPRDAGMPDGAMGCGCGDLEPGSGPELESPTASYDVRGTCPCCACFRGPEDGLGLSGGFTLVVEARLDDRPTERAPVLSRWLTAGDRRAYELGLDRTQYPYLLVSGDGTWGDGASREVVGDRQVRLGEHYVVAAVFEPGAAIRLYINGHLVREVESDVPAGLWEGDTSLMAGARPELAGVPPLGGRLGRLLVYDRALDAATVESVATELGYTDPPPSFAPVRAITEAPGYHWFGYYDKHQISASGRYALGMEVDFEHRAPEPDDQIEVGMVDLEGGDEWITLGHTTAWNWQQGCMLQWLPGSESEVVWNDREGSGDTARYIAKILDVDTGEMRTLPRPIYTIGPNGRTALSTDFERIQVMRPGYGYAGIPDPNGDELAPDDAGIYRMDMESGDSELILSYADAAALPHSSLDLSDAKHYFNVPQINETGDRFMVLHRWRGDGGAGRFRTRFLTAALDGTDVRVLTDRPGLSHHTWRDERTALIYTGSPRGFALYRDGEGYLGRALAYRDGHQSYLPDRRWMVSDTYPDGRRLQRPYLYNFMTDEIVVLGHFRSPREYGGRSRCDTHPRVGRDGNRIVIDSPHDGGRQMYLIDIERIVRERTEL